MIHVNGVYDVTIDDIARETDGIAKIEGMTVFIKDVKIGDKVKIKIDRVLTKFAMGHKV